MEGNMEFFWIVVFAAFVLWLSPKFWRAVRKWNTGHKEQEEMLYNGG